jgi:hypothetical protein
MIREVMMIHGKRCVAIEETELRRLERLAGRESPLPPLPLVDAKGNRPALEYIQVSIARDIIKERRPRIDAHITTRRSVAYWVIRSMMECSVMDSSARLRQRLPLWRNHYKQSYRLV